MSQKLLQFSTLFLLSTVAGAQGWQKAGVPVLGEVIAAEPSGHLPGNTLTVELRGRDRISTVERAAVTWDGRFEFRSVEPFGGARLAPFEPVGQPHQEWRCDHR